MKDDHYAVLGVALTVGTAELRRAYRLMALRHHPDRAGVGATATFQRITEAYRVLSNPAERARYDLRLRARAGGGAQPTATGAATHASTDVSSGAFSEHRAGDPFGSARSAHRRAQAAAARAAAGVLARLSGSLEELVARAAARPLAGGIIELLVDHEEGRTGGVAAIELPIHIRCPTCEGLAARGRLWCCRCEFEGTVFEPVTLYLEIPPAVSDGTTFRVAGDAYGRTPPLSVRIRR